MSAATYEISAARGNWLSWGYLLEAPPMKIIVSSHNPVKMGAVSDAFQTLFSSTDLDFVPVTVDSGVREQPLSDEETRLGALNRASNARLQMPDADYWVGLEGGLERIDQCLLASAWMVIINAKGRLGMARTPTVPLPLAVQALVEQGIEMGEANDRVFETRNSKQAGGAFGLLTEGRMTRRDIYSQAVQLALVPLTHPLWFDATT